MNNKLYELTNPQSNIYMREKFFPGSPINNLSFTFYTEENLDERICSKVINKIIENNDGLRIQISSLNNDVFQYVLPYQKEKIVIHSDSSKSLDDARKDMADDAKIPFILENRKLYKFEIYKLNNGETAIYIKLHHIIADAWVVKVIFQQFNDFYASLTHKKINPSVINSYLDYVDTEKKYFSSDSFLRDKSFWTDYVKNIPESIPFKEICSKKTYISKRFTSTINCSDKINAFCKEHCISPYAFFIAAYSIYLCKAQSKNDFTIGTPLLNRKNIAEKTSIGMFISTVPLKIHINPEENALSLVKNIADNIFAILRHERFPYEEILDLAHTVNNDSTSNLFDTILSFQNIKPDTEHTYFKFENFWNFSACQQTSLELHITDYHGDGNYSLNLDYNENFCNEKEIVYVYNRFINIINQILDNCDTSITDMSFLDDSEKDLVLNSFNKSTSFIPEKTLIEMFDDQVKLHPNKIAVKFKDSQLTYKELDEKVNIFANHLLKHGISGNMPVSILVERSLDMVISMLATLRVGAYYITIDPFWPNDRISYIVENSKSHTLITHKKYVEFHSDIECICIEDIDYSLPIKEITNKPIMTDYAYVIYTSGSTGKPKGTMMTNINIANLLNSTYTKFHQTPDDVWTLFHTYTFDFSAWEIYGCLTTGGTLIIVPKEITINPDEFLGLVIKEKVTILNQTPAYFYKVIDAEKRSESKVTDLKLVILGGEAVFAEPLRYWKTKYPDITIYNGYGPTETTIFAIMGEITHSDIANNNIYIGKPLDNYKITIVNKDLQPLGFGCEGEICITSMSVCSGYFNNSEMTAEKFIHNIDDNGLVLYKSGDVGYWDLDGRIKYIGRNDNQVKIRGFRVELEEIEKELLACEGVSKSVVFPVENSNYTKSLVGFIETQIPNYVDSVLTEIKKNLTSYMIPKLYQVTEMPINDNGKVDRKKLLSNIVLEKREIVHPKTDLELKICKFISTIKNIPMNEISINDDFFQDIGLDSLDIMQLSTDLSEFNIEIQRINNNSSVAKLADAIENNSDNVNYVSEVYDIDIVNKKFKYDLSNVFLTGPSGFLGIHILKELIDNPSVNKIYCFIRPKGNLSAEERLRNTLMGYFDEPIDLLIKKIVVVSGNFEEDLLGLSEEKYSELCKNINTIIHCGANVKHYGNYTSFYKTNVLGTENIIKLAYDSGAYLAHISTLSVAGFSEATSKKFIDENTINIDQKFNGQVYMLTKYEAECKVLDAIDKNLIFGKIYRLGNIMPRYSDGKFQLNDNDNAFLARLRTIVDTKGCPESFYNLPIDLSPVDVCAKSIIALLSTECDNTIYHIYNNNFIKVKNIIRNFNVKKVSNEEEISRIRAANNPYNALLLNDLMNASYIETPAKCKITLKALKKANFKWNKVTSSYLKKIYNIVKSL